MLQAYPQLAVGKFEDFPNNDQDLAVWLEDLEESEAQELCNLLG